MSDVLRFLLSLVERYGYFGAFLGSILGNITIALPTPYAFLITALGTNLNPFILGLVSGLGATIGELSSYGFRLIGRKALNTQQLRNLESVKRLVEKYGFFTIILFAVTPLPDDLLVIPLGVMGYDFKVLVVSLWIGKTVLALGLAYAGFYGFDYLSTLYESMGWGSVIVSVLLLGVIVYTLLKFNWSKIVDVL